MRNKYTLDIYEQVAKLSKFSYDAFLTFNDFDKGLVSSSKLLKLEDKFSELRIEFENTYSKTRNINKPNSYYLDQDHHNHTANQSLNMDWQFIAELKLFEKIKLKKIVKKITNPKIFKKEYYCQPKLLYSTNGYST